MSVLKLAAYRLDEETEAGTFGYPRVRSFGTAGRMTFGYPRQAPF
jgi:hypothetical protein